MKLCDKCGCKLNPETGNCDKCKGTGIIPEIPKAPEILPTKKSKFTLKKKRK